MLNKRWYHIHSHQHCPSSVLQRLCCPSLESVSVYKLYSRPPCIVLNLCFWFRPGISHSLGFDPVTDVPPARASRCSSACQQLEKGLTCRPPVPAVAAPPVSNLKRAQWLNLYLRQPLQLRLSATWKGTDVSPARASRCSSACQQLERAQWLNLYLRCSLRQVSTMRCVAAAQRETAILNSIDKNGSDEAVLSDRRDSRGLPETCERRDWRIRDPTWREIDLTWQKSDQVRFKLAKSFVGKKQLFVLMDKIRRSTSSVPTFRLLQSSWTHQIISTKTKT